ncbi:hypothetical protein nbrc107696_01400 [Gordonia spumicola]|uniref:Uncharacterized protein n=1 Tax=Gordonia spumicola TaxID=589161 RepID=A0A7I9V3E4_9ACTN|nr:hypothetical protein [Gordonia spumicola]GED99693.1 hypothetical protein nbrc107696_01400 [Gordonia spumicola]
MTPTPVILAEAGLSECARSGGCFLDFYSMLLVLVLTVVPVLIVLGWVWWGFSSHAADAIDRSDLSEGSRIGWKLVVVCIPFVGAAAYWWKVSRERRRER